ncbi:MAG: hypothetical protein ACYDCO_18560 [Armatimonadota bacterium]
MTEDYDAALADGGEPREAEAYGDAYAGLEEAYYPSDDETPAEYSDESYLPEGDIPDEGPPEELTDEGLFDEALSDEELTYRERYENLQRLMGRQANELGELRRQLATHPAAAELAAHPAAADEEQEGLLSPEDAPPAEIDREYDSLTETVQPWADEYYREYLDLGFSEEEAAERAWSKAYAEHSRVTELAERIADEKYGNLAPLVEMAAGPQVLKQAVDTVYSFAPTDSITPDEVLEEMIRQYPIGEFMKIPQEYHPVLVALARDLMIGRRVREGQLAPMLPHPAPVPHTGPGGTMHGGSAVSPAHAQRIAQWRQVMGRAGEGISDEQVLARMKEYEREGRR